MSLDKHNNLAESLRNLRTARGLTLAEFSKELGIPKSTLQSVLENSQTSLNTALLISERLDIPMDVLTNGTLSVAQIKILDDLLLKLDWYDRLPRSKQLEVSEHIYALVLVLQENYRTE